MITYIKRRWIRSLNTSYEDLLLDRIGVEFQDYDSQTVSLENYTY